MEHPAWRLHLRKHFYSINVYPWATSTDQFKTFLVDFALERLCEQYRFTRYISNMIFAHCLFSLTGLLVTVVAYGMACLIENNFHSMQNSFRRLHLIVFFLIEIDNAHCFIKLLIQWYFNIFHRISVFNLFVYRWYIPQQNCQPITYLQR